MAYYELEENGTGTMWRCMIITDRRNSFTHWHCSAAGAEGEAETIMGRMG